MTRRTTEQGGGAGRSTIGGIARSGSANLLAAGIGSVANLAVVVIVTRGWSPHLAGSFFAVTSLFLICLSLVELGVDQGFVRFHARNIALGRHGVNSRISRAGFATVGAVSVVVAALLVLVAGPVGHLIADQETATDVSVMIRIVAVALPVAACYDLVLALTRGRSVMRPTIVVERICRPSLQVVLLVVAATRGAAPALLAVAWALPYAFGLVAVAIVARRLPPSGTAAVAEPDDGAVGDFWRFTAPRGVSRLFQVGLQRADIAIVAALAGPAASAVYTAATRFLVVGQVATQALQQVSEPHLARLLALDEQGAVRSVYHQLTLWSVALTWPVYLMVAVFAEPLLDLIFGAQYVEGAPSLALLAVTMLFSTAMGPVDVLLLMAGRSVLSLVNTGTALAIDVVGCLLLVPVIGIEGAAMAWAAAIVSRNILGMVQVARHLHITPWSMTSTLMALACVGLFGAVPWVTGVVAGSTAAAVGAGAAGAIVYGVVVWRMADSLALRAVVARRRPS